MEDKKIDSNIYELEDNLNELELKKLIIIIVKIFTVNYYRNALYFFNLYKIRVINQIIYENKYFITYKRLYALRNLIINFSYKSFNSNDFKNIVFNYWYNTKKNQFTNSQIFRLMKINYLRNIILNAIIKNIKCRFNARMTKKYFLLLMKYYNYLIDKYYIRAIIFAKNIFNCVRKTLKPYKSKFFSRIHYNIQEEDIINIFKYILINFIKNNYNQQNKKEEVISLIRGFNNTINHNYDDINRTLLKTNEIYIILYINIINKFLLNKDIYFFFDKWKTNSLHESLYFNFQTKEKYVNNLIFSKIFMFILAIKKIIANNFEILYNNLYKKQRNGLILNDSYELLSILNFESLYDNYLFRVLKGLYKLQKFRNIYNSRIFKMNEENKKIIILNKWKKTNYIICNNYGDNNSNIYYYKIRLIKGMNLIDKLFFLFYNKKISKLVNSLIIYYSYNKNKENILLKLNVFFEIFKKNILYKRKKYIFQILIKLSSLTQEDKILKNELSFFIINIEHYILKKKSKYLTYFFYKFKKYNFTEYIRDFNNKYYIKVNKSDNISKNKKLVALKKILKYFINNTINNNFISSIKNTFYFWSSLIGHIPKSLKETEKDYIYNNESEDEEDIINKRNEIQELQKCLKEDKDFQHDLKAKITALDEENAFICEKIFEITQRVEKCEKCSILLKTSNKSDNNLRISYKSMNKSIHGNNITNNNNNNKKSRNVFPIDGASTSGLNFGTIGTELIPRKPMASSHMNEEPSDPGSEQMDDVDENQVESNNYSEPYLNEIKQKIIDLKNEKDPIINKLKDEIRELYLELNMV